MIKLYSLRLTRVYFTILFATAFSTLWADQLPSLGFIENKGQMTDVTGRPVNDVLFRCSTPGLDLYVRESGLTYVFTKHNERVDRRSPEKKKIHSYSYETIHLNLPGAFIRKGNALSVNPALAISNFYLGHCPDGIMNVTQSDKVIFKNIYPGVDWVLYNSDKHGFKYDFVVNPGADASLIRLEYVSLYEPLVNAKGDIIIKTPLGTLSENAPISYLQDNKQQVFSEFTALSKVKDQRVFRSLFGISVDKNASQNKTLIIDPQLTWATFFGGSNIEGSRTLETDASGNVFIAGYTVSSNLPLMNSGGYYQGSVAALTYQFITKFSPTGALLWSTFYSGTGVNLQTDVGGLDIDASGNVFLCGFTQTTNFPVQTNSTFFQGTNAGVQDAYLIKFNNLGARLWATYFGGSSVDNATGVTIDQAGNVYMVGTTQSANFPLMNGGGYFQNTFSFTTAGFMTKFSNNGNLLWSTFYEGIQPFATDVDNSGNLYVTGTGNTGAMILLNPGGGAYFQGTGNSVESAVIKFNSNTTLLWSTYFGGVGFDMGRSIVTDKFGNVFMAGLTTSTVFPLLNAGGFFQSTIGNINITTGDAFITKFSPTGSLLWSTYCGGNSDENFMTYDNLDVDTCGNVYFSFDTKSTNMVTKTACEGGYRDSVLDVASTSTVGDVYLARFKNNTSLDWATYLGGNGGDFRSSLSIDNNQQLYISGEWVLGSLTNNYQTVSGGVGSYLATTSAGSDDIYMMRFNSAPGAQSFSYTTPVCTSAGSTAATGALVSGGLYSSAPGLSINPLSGVITPSASTPGTYTVSYSYTVSTCACGVSPTSSAGVVVTTVAIHPAPVLTVTGNYSICLGSATTVSVTGANTYSWNSGQQSSTVTFSPNSTMIFTVTGASTVGCSAKKEVTITVVPNPNINVAGNSVVCLGDTVTLSASGATSFSWSGGPSTPNYVFVPVSNTTVVLSGTNSACSSSINVPVTVKPVPTVSVSGAGTLCAGQSTVLTASGAQTYLWSTSSTSKSITVGPATSSVYVVTGVAVNGCKSTATVQLIVSNCVGVEKVFEEAGLKVFPNPNKGSFKVVATTDLDLILTNSLGQKVKEISLNRSSDHQVEIIDLARGIYFLKPVKSGGERGMKIVVE